MRRGIVFIALFLLALGFDVAHAQQQTFELTAAQGLAGVTNVTPGSEVKIYHAHLRDFFDNARKSQLGPVPGPAGIDVTVSDLSAPTGLVAGDFTELRLYRSNDANFDAGDTFMTSTTPVGIGAATLLDISGVPAGDRGIPEIDDGPNEVYFIITAVIAAGATAGHAFRLGTAGVNVDIRDFGGGPASNYQVGSAIVAADANRVVIVAAGGGGGGGGGSAPITSIPAMPAGVYGLLATLLMGYGIYSLRDKK